MARRPTDLQGLARLAPLGPRLKLGGLAGVLLLLLGMLAAALNGCEVLLLPGAPVAPSALVTATPSAAPAPLPIAVSSTPTRTPTRAATSVPAPSATRAFATPTRPAGMVIPTPMSGERLPTISFDRLPSEGRDTIRLIAHDGPFPYRQDGVVFENRERLLPLKAGGYYHEYTVDTPGSPDRGARRIIMGGQGELYYTDDHYASFKRVVP